MKTISSSSANIFANTGPSDSIDFQDNGTERLKGSYPNLIVNPAQLISHLITEVSTKITDYDQKVSRVCCRYFITKDAYELGKDLFNKLNLNRIEVKIETAIHLKRVSDEVGVPVYWVWIGGNLRERRIGENVRQTLLKKLGKAHDEKKVVHPKLIEDYTPYVVSKFHSDFKSFIQHINITKKLAEEIAHLYKQRIPVYVADNNKPEYILNTVAKSPDTDLFILVNNQNKKVEAVIANEFCNYPLTVANKKALEVKICESNDWVKTKSLSSEIFMQFLLLTLTLAETRNPDVIETECVPEAFSAAFNSGFKYAGILERTSHMKTDGENVELSDEEIPEYYRKFNSLFLFYKNPLKKEVAFLPKSSIK